MAIPYKLKPDIIALVVKTSQDNPKLGCRKLAALLHKQAKITLSKSSISSILKGASINKPVGPRFIHNKHNLGISPRQEKKPPIQPNNQPTAVSTVKKNQEPLIEKLGYWFLKAADISLGATEAISEALRKVIFDKEISELAAKNEALLYSPFFQARPGGDISPQIKYLIGKPYTKEDLKSHEGFLNPLSSINKALVEELNKRLRLISKIKFSLNKGSVFFVDANLHSIWPSSHIPKEFFSPVNKARECIQSTILNDRYPLILQAPGGFNNPDDGFFGFICATEGPAEKEVRAIQLYDIKDNLIEEFTDMPQRQILFIMGLWPWQYEKCRAQDFVSGFQPFTFKLTNEAFSLAEGKVMLKSVKTQEETVFRSIVIKKDNSEILSLLTNIDSQGIDSQAIATAYLERWPNLEAGYQDFLSRISQGRAMVDELTIDTTDEELSLEAILDYLRLVLNKYCQERFLPSNCSELDIISLKERFYELKGQITHEFGHFKIKFNVQIEQNNVQNSYEYLEQLKYACQKVNEQDLRLSDGSRLFFEV